MFSVTLLQASWSGTELQETPLVLAPHDKEVFSIPALGQETGALGAWVSERRDPGGMLPRAEAYMFSFSLPQPKD